MFEVKKTTLANGVRIISQEHPHVFSVALSLWWQMGSRNESQAQAGLTHFLEHMAFKGTAHRSVIDIAREIDILGGQANAFTSKEHTCFHGRSLADKLPQLADLLVDIALNPSLDSEELERERGVILQEIAGMEDTPDDLVFVLLQEDFWPDHPLGRSILGYPATVSSFTADDIRQYMSGFHVGSRLVVSAAGNVKHEALVALLAPLLENLSTRQSAAQCVVPATSAGMRVVQRDSEQEHILLALPGLPANHEQRMDWAVLNLILGGNMSSRLFQEVRERRGLAYSVYSFLTIQEDSGMWGIYMGLPPERAAEGLSVVREELEKLNRNSISQQELIDARESLRGGILLAAENLESRAARLARNEFTFARHVALDEVLHRLDKVDMRQLGELAESLLDVSKLRLLALGPAKERDLHWK